MRRTQIYLTDAQWRELASICRDRGVTKSTLIREAVDQAYLSRPSHEAFSKALQAARGIWKGRREVGDPVAYVRSLRRGSRRDRYLKGQWRRSS